MKLRNKKTGEILGLGSLIIKNPNRINCESIINYDSLAELNEDWEDYEDELFYVISSEHKSGYQCVLKDEHPEICNVAKELGIGFENEKDCKKAVEKLKAWKRLKDNGFKFKTWGWENEKDNEYVIWFELNDKEGDCSDLELLFGGEE